MDVKVFHFKNLPEEVGFYIRVRANKSFGYTKSTPLEQWFSDFCKDVIITRIHGEAWPKKYYITDYKIQMPNDKYVEFCLRWL